MLKNAAEYPFLGQLEPADLEAVHPYLNVNIYKAGEIILKQGQVSEQFHIVLSGTLDICLEQELEVSVAQLARGQFFGEMSCLTGERVSATVKAEGDVRTLSMTRDGLLLLMDRSSPFRKQMIDAMIQRIGHSNKRVMEEHTRSFVVMREMEKQRQSQYGELVGNSPFMHRLREMIAQLARHNRTVCVVGEPGVGKVHIACAIHYKSAHSRNPLLIVDAASFRFEEWELKLRAAKGGTIVLKHADCLPPDVLHQIVRSAGELRLLLTMRKAVEMEADAPVIQVIPLRERTEDIPYLVFHLLAKAGVSEPMEAVSQEALRMLGLFPYLRGNVTELDKVLQEALVLSGGKLIRNTHLRFGKMREPGARPIIGLALGSGSVRGAAHIGVLKVLEQENIPVDLIAGSSVGAFLGALYAGGQPISAFERVLPTVRWRQLVRFAFSTRALVDNHPMIRFVEKYIGPVDFEDLSIPFAAVASDASTGEASILNTGRVSHAICASTAIPGIIKPVSYHGRQLVDGGVVHPVPAALARSMGADIVIAVNVSIPPYGKRTSKHFISAILNTIELMSVKIVEEEMQLADIVLHPQFESSQITFKASPAYIRTGEKTARDAMSGIKSKLEAAGYSASLSI